VLVNGLPPEHKRPHFANLTPLHPREPLRMGERPLKGSGAAATRIIDLMAPVARASAA